MKFTEPLNNKLNLILDVEEFNILKDSGFIYIPSKYLYNYWISNYRCKKILNKFKDFEKGIKISELYYKILEHLKNENEIVTISKIEYMYMIKDILEHLLRFHNFKTREVIK